MKTLILYLSKKYLLSSINDTLEKYKDNVAKVTSVLSTWIDKLEKIITQLKLLNQRFSDGKFDDDEAEATKEEIS